MIIDHQQKQVMRFHACELHIDEYIRQLADLAALDAAQHDRAELTEFIRAGLRRGIFDHDLTWEVDVVTFLAWRQLFGQHFDELPAVRNAFLATRDEPGSRLALIVRHAPKTRTSRTTAAPGRPVRAIKIASPTPFSPPTA